jgi:hypothetical protein
MFKAINIFPATSKDNYDAMMKQFSNRFLSSVNYKLYKSIEEKAEITDSRHLFY